MVEPQPVRARIERATISRSKGKGIKDKVEADALLYPLSLFLFPFYGVWQLGKKAPATILEVWPLVTLLYGRKYGRS